MARIDINIKTREFELEKARMLATETQEFSELKNDTQRKAFIFMHTQQKDQELAQTKASKQLRETEILEVKTEHDATYQKFWALRTASEQIAAYMNFAAAGEQP
jgi:hypothetical protein